MATEIYLGQGPDAMGQFGRYGGCYMPETLMPALQALEQAFTAACADDGFWQQYRTLLRDYVGRPSPLYLAERLTQELGGARFSIDLPCLA